MRAQTIVITGANRGIGLAIARIYRERGDRVIGLCRRASDDLRDCGAEIVEGVDVTSSQALQRAAAAVEKVDVLIANAGVLSNEPFSSVADARHGIERQFTVNALGPLLTAHAFADKLAAGAKVALITSRMGPMQLQARQRRRAALVIAGAPRRIPGTAPVAEIGNEVECAIRRVLVVM